MKKVLRLSLITLLGRRCCRTAAEMQLQTSLQKITQLMQAEDVRGKREI